MKWRVIARFSFERDKGSKLRNQLAGVLKACGIENTKTGSWEGSAVSPSEAAQQLGAVLQALAVVTEQAEGDSVDLDHVWIYIDRAI